MENEIHTGQSLPGDGGTASSGGASADVRIEGDTLSLEDINRTLGKDFKDLPTALKAIKDTASYVGDKDRTVKTIAKELGVDEKEVVKKVRDLKTAATVDPALANDLAEVKKDIFFSKRPELAPYKEVLEAFALKEGKTIEQAADSDSFKAVFEKAKGFDEIQSKRTVLESNTRLGVATDKIAAAQEAMQKAYTAPNHVEALRAHEQAKDAVLDAIVDIFNLADTKS